MYKFSETQLKRVRFVNAEFHTHVLFPLRKLIDGVKDDMLFSHLLHHYDLLSKHVKKLMSLSMKPPRRQVIRWFDDYVDIIVGFDYLPDDDYFNQGMVDQRLILGYGMLMGSIMKDTINDPAIQDTWTKRIAYFPVEKTKEWYPMFIKKIHLFYRAEKINRILNTGWESRYVALQHLMKKYPYRFANHIPNQPALSTNTVARLLCDQTEKHWFVRLFKSTKLNKSTRILIVD